MDPYHDGERLAQERAGQQRDARLHGRMIAPLIMGGAIPFLEAQRLVAFASAGDDGLWASVVVGAPGFLQASETSVEIDLARVARDPDDPLWRSVGRDVGLLAIDLATRRRYRVNGPLVASGEGRLRLEVREAYPNCPRYIQARLLLEVGPRASGRAPTSGTLLTDDAAARVRRADTSFVASGHPERGLDASHRGGRPGFIEVVGPDRLRIPDYHGNGMFNTLGNLLVDPRAGLTIVDFEEARVLQMTGRASVEWGAERSWDLAIERWTERDLPFAMRWTKPEASPVNP